MVPACELGVLRDRNDSVFIQARDLPPDKRWAAEILLGGKLGEDELLLVRSSKGHILKPGAKGEARDQAFKRLMEWSAEMAKRVEGVPEAEIEAAIDEAVDFVVTTGDANCC